MSANAIVRECKSNVCNECGNMLHSCDGCGETLFVNQKIECYNFGDKHFCRRCAE